MNNFINSIQNFQNKNTFQNQNFQINFKNLYPIYYPPINPNMNFLYLNLLYQNLFFLSIQNQKEKNEEL